MQRLRTVVLGFIFMAFVVSPHNESITFAQALHQFVVALSFGMLLDVLVERLGQKSTCDEEEGASK